ncbi:unnamed protein product [Paramecium primaurelia]|uniref:Protein kinase domain-containing protein n=1 Tax=Paramecium primaurelia TaxID=5886 RepID=A0A8S1LUW7_PARPR|nr:unnamed protein product [Paramecium primaurelia]
MQNKDQGLFKTVAINNIVYLNLEKGLVYIPNKKVGEDAGNNGEIFKGYIGYNTDKQIECCVKKFSIPTYDKQMYEKLHQELIFGRQLVHKNIVKFYECSRSDNNFYMFMEYCNGGSLAERMSLGYEDSLMSTKIFSEVQAINIIQQIIDALIYMKELSYDGKVGAVHRDIKPDNIMFQNDIPKLIDFGMSRFMDKQTITHYKGSPIYMSPQNLRFEKYDLEKNDVWGIGIILFQLVEGIYPWRMALNSLEDLQKAQEKIKNNIQFKNKVSEELQSLIRHMLQYDEQDRCDWNQVTNYQIIKHQNHLQINTINRLVLNYELFEDLQTKLNIEKLSKCFLDLTLTTINNLKEFLPKNSSLEKKIDQLYIKRILQKRKFHTFKSERALKYKLSQRLVKYLEQLILDTIDQVQTKNVQLVCQIIISLYKTDAEFKDELPLTSLLQLAKL